jgi:membrane protein involved in colicin uptake
MAEIVNLNRARKAKARAEAEATAAANRAKHGRTAAQRERAERIEARRRALLDGARLEKGSGAPDGGGGRR